MLKGKGAERIVINLDIFTNSAKPDITGEVKLTAGPPGEPVTMDLLLSFPENDIPKKIEINISGPVKSPEKSTVVPESKEFEHRMILDTLFSDTSEHELKVVLKHGVYYTTILPDMIRTYSCTPQEVTIKRADTCKYRVLAGEPVEVKITLEAPGNESTVDLSGNIIDAEGKKIIDFNRKRVTFSGEHTETFLASIPDNGNKGEMGVEIFLLHYGIKTSKRFDNVLRLVDQKDISLSITDIEPRSILAGNVMTVTAGIANIGIEPLDISARLRLRKNGEDILSVPLGKMILEPNSDRKIIPKEYRFIVEETQELSPGKYDLLLEIMGDVETSEKGGIEVTGGTEIELFGATTDKYSYCSGESVHLTALYRIGGRLRDERFTARVTAKSVKGKIVHTSDEVLDINREEPKDSGEVEWVVYLDDKISSGYMNVTFEIFVEPDNTQLSVLRLPYMFSIKGTRQFSVKVVKEKAPVDIGAGLPEDLKREIRNYLFHGEKVADTVHDKKFSTIKLDNGTYLNLHQGKVIAEPDEMKIINSAVLARTAANMGFDRYYLEKLRHNIDRTTFLVESIIYSYREDFSLLQVPDKNRPALETRGSYTVKMINGHRRALQKKIGCLPKGRKRLTYAKKVRSDVYVLENLIKRISKKSGSERLDTSALFEHFHPLGDELKKSNRSLKNTEMAAERLKQLDLDYASFFNKNVDYLITLLDSGSFKENLIRKMDSANPEYDPGHEKIYPIALGFMSVYFLKKVSKGIKDFFSGGEMEPEGLAAHIYNFNMSYLHLYLFFSTISFVIPSQESKCVKACTWLRDCLRSNTRNHSRIIDETLKFLSDYKKNMKIRKKVAEFRSNVQIQSDYDRSEGAEGTLLEIPISAISDAKKDILMDYSIILPGKDYNVHWPPAKTIGENNYIEGFRLAPGTNNIPFRIELPTSLPDHLPEIKILAHPRKGNLVARDNTPAYGSMDSSFTEWTKKADPHTEIGSVLLDENIIKHIAGALIRPGRYAEIGKESIGYKVEKELLLDDTAKKMGMHRKKLYDILKESKLFKLSDVAVKGGFLRLRTVVSHYIRFATSKEIHETLMESPRGLLPEASKHRVTAARVLSVYIKILQEMPGVKRSGSEKRVFIPVRPQAKDLLSDLMDKTADSTEARSISTEITSILVKEVSKHFTGKKDEIILPGNRPVNTFKGLVSTLVEMEPKDVKRFIVDYDLNSFLENTIPGKVLSSACISTRSRIHLADPPESDIKYFLLQHISRSPLKECIFELITKPNLENILYQSKIEAAATLSRLSNVVNSYTAPALAGILFTVPKGTRPTVLKVLGELKDERVIPSLVKMLKSSVEREDRRAALKALISINTAEALKQAELLMEENREIKSVAEKFGFRVNEETSHEDEHIILE